MAYAQLLAGVYAAGKAAWPQLISSLEHASAIYKRLGDPFRWQQSRSDTLFPAQPSAGVTTRDTEALLDEISGAASQMAFVQVRAWTWSARMACSRWPDDRAVNDRILDFNTIPIKSLPVSERLLCTGSALAQAQLRSGRQSAADRSERQHRARQHAAQSSNGVASGAWCRGYCRDLPELARTR